jgi:hypothetical protein
MAAASPLKKFLKKVKKYRPTPVYSKAEENTAPLLPPPHTHAPHSQNNERCTELFLAPLILYIPLVVLVFFSCRENVWGSAWESKMFLGEAFISPI